MKFSDARNEDEKRIAAATDAVAAALSSEPRADIALEGAIMALAQAAVRAEQATGQPVCQWVAVGFMKECTKALQENTAIMGPLAEA